MAVWGMKVGEGGSEGRGVAEGADCYFCKVADFFVRINFSMLLCQEILVRSYRSRILS